MNDTWQTPNLFSIIIIFSMWSFAWQNYRAIYLYKNKIIKLLLNYL